MRVRGTCIMGHIKELIREGCGRGATMLDVPRTGAGGALLHTAQRSQTHTKALRQIRWERQPNSEAKRRRRDKIRRKIQGFLDECFCKSKGIQRSWEATWAIV